MRTANAALTGCTTVMNQLGDEYLAQHQYAVDYHCTSGNPSVKYEPAANAYPYHSSKDGGGGGGEYFASATDPYYYDAAFPPGYYGGYGGPYDAYSDNWSSSPQEYASSGGVDGSQSYWTPADVCGPLQPTSLTLQPPPPPLLVPETVGFCDVDDFRSVEHGLLQFQPAGCGTADQTTCTTNTTTTDQFSSKCTSTYKFFRSQSVSTYLPSLNMYNFIYYAT